MVRLNLSAISPEQERTNKRFGMGAGEREPGQEFDPEQHDPQDPNSWTRMVKPIGNYGWGGLAAIGEGLHNAWVMNKAEAARGEQRQSQAAGRAALDEFIGKGGMAGGLEALAPMLKHPAMRQTGMQLYMDDQRDKRSRETSDRQHERQLALADLQYQKSMDLDERKTQRTADRDDRREIMRLRTIEAQAEETRKRDEEKVRVAKEAEDERRRYYDEMYTRDGNGDLQLRTPNAGDGMGAAPQSEGPAPPLRPGMGGGLGAFRGRMELGGPKDDLSVGPAPSRPMSGVQVAQADGPLRRIEIPQPGQNASAAELKAWAAAQDAARKANKEIDRADVIANKPRGVEDNSMTNERIQDYYRAKFGELSKGRVYRRDGTVQNLELTQAERKDLEIAQDAVEAVRHTRELLKKTGPLDETFGFGVDLPVIGKLQPGKLWKGGEDAMLAHNQMETAVHDFLRIMSGATVANKERDAYVRLYMPSATDTARQRAQKLDRVEAFFNRTIKSKMAGATTNDISAMIRGELKNEPGSVTFRDSKSPTAPQAITPSGPSSGAPSRKVYDRATGGFKDVR
jgi:hypothetical protein